MTETRQFGRRRALPARNEEPAPAAAPATRTASAPASGTGGWDEMDRVAAGASGDLFFKVTEDEIVIKIIDASPFDSYVCHWLDEIEEGSKSIRCWGQDAGCPLCAIGDKAKKFSACFNVVSLEDPAHPALRVWETGVKIAKQLKAIATDDKKGPLDRPDLYFTIKKVAKAGAKNVEYVLERIRSRDLEEETGLLPLTKDVLEHFAGERYSDPVKEALDKPEMDKIVKMLLDA